MENKKKAPRKDRYGHPSQNGDRPYAKKSRDSRPYPAREAKPTPAENHENGIHGEYENGAVIGRNAVRELLRSGRPIDKLMVQRGERTGSIVVLVAEAIERGIPVIEVEKQKLDGMDEVQLRDRSHLPQKYYGQTHFMPCGKDSALLLQVNRARCAARSAELAAVHAFTDRDGCATRPDILQAMNRLSSYLYVLMIRLKSKQ